MTGTKVQSENIDGLRYKMIHTKPDGIKLQDFEEKEGSEQVQEGSEGTCELRRELKKEFELLWLPFDTRHGQTDGQTDRHH